MNEDETKALRATKESYSAFRRMSAYEDLLNYLRERREEGLSNAEESDNTNIAYGYLKNAQAYKTVMSYIERMSKID